MYLKHLYKQTKGCRDKIKFVNQIKMLLPNRWYGHVLPRDEGDVLRRALEFEVDGKRGKGRLKVTWKGQVEKEMRKIGLQAENLENRKK